MKLLGPIFSAGTAQQQNWRGWRTRHSDPIFIACMSFSVAAVDELNPCIYNILRTTEVHIFQSIHYLDRLQFINARMILSSIKPQKSPAWAAGPFKPHSWKNLSINAVNHCRQRQQPKLYLERQEFQFQQLVDHQPLASLESHHQTRTGGHRLHSSSSCHLPYRWRTCISKLCSC